MISGKAKDLFLKWFKEEKQLTGFEDKPILTQIFALCEWLKTQGYAISTKSSYYDSNYSAKISFNEGDINIRGHECLEKALISAVELATEDSNDQIGISLLLTYGALLQLCLTANYFRHN